MVYRAFSIFPTLVQRAINLSDLMDYTRSASEEVGRLLQILVNVHSSGVIGELSTGCGVAAAWIVSVLSPAATFLTVEEDPTRAVVAQTLFEHFENVRVSQGDWRQILRPERFSLLFAGINSEREDYPDLLLESLREGGMIVMDGLIPGDPRDAGRERRSDPLRDFWLNDPRLLATEVQVSAAESVLLATRLE